MVSTGRLKVLQIGKFFTPHSGGMETCLSMLCSGMKDRLDLSVIVANEGPATVRETVDGVPVTRAATLVELRSQPICPAMASLIRATPADIVHLHFPNPMGALAYLMSGHKGALVITYHSDIVRQRFLASLLEPLLSRTLDRARALIATSPNLVEHSAVLRPRRGLCRVIPYGIPVGDYLKPDEAAVAAIRARHPGPIVLGVGRLVYYKGYCHLIEAMKEVPATLLLIGGGPLAATLERQARDLGVAERVVFLGDRHDFIPYYHAADVFALPSTHTSEAFGIVQIEAMAAGIPVVNTSLGSGVPFVSPHGETGLTVPPGDPKALAAAINSLLLDPPRRKALGEAGRRRAASEFAVERMVERTLALYQEVLDGAVRPI